MLNCSPRALEKLLSDLKALDYTGYAEQYPPFGSWTPLEFRPRELAAVWKKSLALCPSAGLYVNIPFCRTKCDFCFLPVTATGPDDAVLRSRFSAYFKALAAEASLFSGVFSGHPLKTLYIGGGTPSLMTPKEIEKLFSIIRSNFSLARSAQITTEIHPETADGATLKAFRDGGVNWLCIGAQSLSLDVLRRARRSQSLATVVRAYELARRAGIKGINIDLICGLPGQTEKSFLEDVGTVAALRPDEIHLNTFIVTPFTLYGRRGGKPAPQEHTERLKEKGFALLKARGYGKLHYDSSGLDEKSKNFQTSDLRNKSSVLGLGPGAVSHAWGGARYINDVSLENYLARLAKRRPPADRGCLATVRDEMIYYFLESLSNEPRRLDLREFRKLFGAGLKEVLGEELRLLKAGGIREKKDILTAKATDWNLLRGVLYGPKLLLNLAGAAAR